jgi:transposase
MIASDDAVVYLLDPSRSKEVPNAFFAGSVGTLMTDRLASYKGLHDGIRKAWCWVHVRRDFLKIYQGVQTLMPWARWWLEAIAKLFVLNQRRFTLWESGGAFGEQWTIAQSSLEEHVKQMEHRWKEELQLPKLHKLQKTVLRSLQRHWEGLTLFLIDPRIPLHNNRAERLLRNAVILRKNSYGSGSIWAGEFASKIFSIFQTWLINGLNPEALLEDFFNEVSKPGHPPPRTENYLPWTMSAERKRCFALPKAFRRPG